LRIVVSSCLQENETSWLDSASTHLDSALHGVPSAAFLPAIPMTENAALVCHEKSSQYPRRQKILSYAACITGHVICQSKFLFEPGCAARFARVGQTSKKKQDLLPKTALN
jgi:hypothetical protein